MSELTFNIADYRPLFRARAHDFGPAVKERRGFVVLSSHAETETENEKAHVVDIRSVREGHRTWPRRGNVLKFRNPSSRHVYMMPAHHATAPVDDDPGPMVA